MAISVASVLVLMITGTAPLQEATADRMQGNPETRAVERAETQPREEPEGCQAPERVYPTGTGP